MKLSKALKFKKSLVGEITKLKQQINVKNSYIVGSLNAEKFNVEKLYEELLRKIEELTTLKFVINEANRDIQSKIYLIAEYKALIVFWNNVSVLEGNQFSGYSDNIKEYKVQIDETKRNQIVEEFQKKVDALQDEIDEYNIVTEISCEASKKEETSI